MAAVAIPLSREPCETPAMFTLDQNTSATEIVSAVPALPDSDGTSTPSVEEKIVATAAVANVPSSQSRTPDRKPA